VTFDWFVLLTPLLLLALLLPFLFIGCGAFAAATSPTTLVLKFAPNINNHHYANHRPMTMVTAHFTLERTTPGKVVFDEPPVMGGVPPAAPEIDPAATIIRTVPDGATADCYKVTCYCELRFGTEAPYDAFTTSLSEMPFHHEAVHEFVLNVGAADKWDHKVPPFTLTAMPV
jgi:hypothetical protein